MSISAVNGMSPVSQQAGSQVTASMPRATSFGQELDSQTGSVHPHRGGASQSVMSSLAGMASAAGVTSPMSIAASLAHLLT